MCIGAIKYGFGQPSYPPACFRQERCTDCHHFIDRCSARRPNGVHLRSITQACADQRKMILCKMSDVKAIYRARWPGDWVTIFGIPTASRSAFDPEQTFDTEAFLGSHYMLRRACELQSFLQPRNGTKVPSLAIEHLRGAFSGPTSRGLKWWKPGKADRRN